MKTCRLILSIFILFWISGSTVLAGEDEVEYQKNLENLNDRFKDFHIQEQIKKRWEFERKKDADEMNALRQRRDERREQARENFIKNRKPKPEPLLDDSVLAKELAKRAKQQEIARKKYIKNRNKLRAILEKAKKIPEAKDVGLE